MSLSHENVFQMENNPIMIPMIPTVYLVLSEVSNRIAGAPNLEVQSGKATDLRSWG